MAFLAIRDRPSDEVARELIEKVGEWSKHQEPEDDRTVVVLKRHFGPAPTPDERRTTGSLTVPKPV